MKIKPLRPKEVSQSVATGMPFEILSPSYGRPTTCLTHKIIPLVTYVVHEFEADAYLAAGHRVRIAPDSLQGNIARVRNFCLDSRQTEDVLLVDDDLQEFKKWTPTEDWWTRRSLSGDELEDFIEQGFIMAREWDVPLWGVNPVDDKTAAREYTPFANKSYCSGSFHALRNPRLRYDESIPLKEDFDYCIQVLAQYRRLLRFNMFYILKRDHKNRGGCSHYRTIEREQEQIRLLQEKWGTGIVRLDSGERHVEYMKGRKDFDLNPMMRVPIGGV